MRRFQILSLFLLLIAVGLTAFTRLPGPVSAEDFRMETDVFSGSATDPIVETLTIFQAKMVYDFMGPEGEEITIFDIPRGSIVLLDRQREIKTTITTSQLMAFMATVKSQPRQSVGQRLLDPQFQEQYNPTSQVLTLSDVQLSYRVKGIKPKDPEFAQRFQLFADCYARLNATRFGNPPPFGRIKLNQSLAGHGLIPTEIERTITTSISPRRKQKMRSRHLTNWQLTETDRKRISHAKTCLANFREVTPEHYWQIARSSSNQ